VTNFDVTNKITISFNKLERRLIFITCCVARKVAGVCGCRRIVFICGGLDTMKKKYCFSGC